LPPLLAGPTFRTFTAIANFLVQPSLPRLFFGVLFFLCLSVLAPPLFPFSASLPQRIARFFNLAAAAARRYKGELWFVFLFPNLFPLTPARPSIFFFGRFWVSCVRLCSIPCEKSFFSKQIVPSPFGLVDSRSFFPRRLSLFFFFFFGFFAVPFLATSTLHV